MSKKQNQSKDISESYDDLPYTSHTFPQTHPSYLQAVCSLFGVETPTVESANILEIGCSFGGNILSLAIQYPQASIVGLDISEKQISGGASAIKAAGLKNIHLQQQDISTYEVPKKHFDYIICHGVYSWVPEQVRKAIFRVISQGLSNKGIAIVSYNTYPGWKVREVYRDAMIFRGQVVDNLRDKVQYGMGMMEFLSTHLPQTNPFGVTIKQDYEQMRSAGESYVGHEYLESVNEPCYFHKFMASAQEKGLHFIAEADFQNHFNPIPYLDDKSHRALKVEAAGDMIKLEQLYDFLTNRTFRQTILTGRKIKQSVQLGDNILHHEMLSELHISGAFFKEADEVSGEVQWKSKNNPQGTSFKDMPMTEVVFTILNAADGQTVKVSRLWEEVQATLKTKDNALFFDVIGAILLERAITIRSHPIHWQLTDSHFPCISATHRKLLQWIKDNPDTIGLSTVFHEIIPLNPVALELIPLIDGKHSKEDLIQRLIADATVKKIIFYDEDNRAITDSKQITTTAKECTEELLTILQQGGLLC